MKQDYNSKVYQKPQNELGTTYEEQLRQKKQRQWTGKPVAVQEDSDDDIFQMPKEVIRKPIESKLIEQSIEATQEISTFQQVHQDNIQVEVVDEEEAMLRRRRALQSRMLEEEIVQEQEKPKKKAKKPKKKKEQIVQIEEPMESAEEEQPREIEMLKPVFVPRGERDRLDKLAEEEIRMKEEKERNQERMKLETKVLVLNAVRADANIKVNEDDDDNGLVIPNDEDTMDEREYALWKIREIKRIKAYNDQKHKYQREQSEVDRRRQLTDQQRIEEDFKLGSDKTKLDDKSKYVFMQKYYHKGAYFQDSEDPIFQRDYNLPVGEDLWDKSKLPGIMQKRRGIFGKRAQSKYTHLTDQDTTDFNPEYQVASKISQKNLSKQAGMRTANNFNTGRK